ncbi:MAG: integrase arm-type DNA-binding domain-containing protein [Cellvibrionaceae bacterium]
MALTELTIKQAKPRDKDYKLSDEKGLYLLITKAGAKYWRLKYRHPQTKKERKLSFGVYPEVGLKQARDKREEARKLLSDGIDPSDHKKAHKAAQHLEANNNFEAVANEWYSKKLPSWAEATAKKQRAILDTDLIPYLHHRPVADIETWELVAVLDRIVARGAVGTAQKARQALNAVCRYAKQTGRSKHNPANDLVGTLPQRKTKHRAAIIQPTKFGKLLIDIEKYSGSHIARTMLQLAPLLFQRPTELASMEWSEINLEEGLWTIPKEKKKERGTGREEDHVVPLATQAIALLEDIQPLTGRYKYVFPNRSDYSKHATIENVTKALKALGYDTGKEQSFHGFRASARTMLAQELHEREDLIEHQLAHQVKDPNGRAYNRTTFLPERKALMQRWADYLEGLRQISSSSNVVLLDAGPRP